jgi:hypothetical protein
MLFPPAPNYDYDVKKLVNYYEQAMKDLRAELSELDLTDFQRANVRATLTNVKAILRELDASALSWVDRYIPQAVSDGITRALIAIGLSVSFSDARDIIKFNRINRELVKAAVADTQSDLLAVTQNVERKVRAAVRQATAEAFRANLPKGVNATASLRQDITARLRVLLGESVNTGIIDAAGRRWKPTTYVDMVARTKMMEAHKEATVNEALSRDVKYAVISAHGAKDMCRIYEGKVVKLDPSAPGDYPYLYNLPRRDIFHPNCKHVLSPIRRPENLPEDLLELNGM